MDASGRGGGGGRLALLLGLACFTVYLSNLRQVGAWDSIPARLLPFSILREGNLDLNEFSWLFRADPNPYFLYRTADGRWRSRYSIAAPLLVTPLSIPAVYWLQHRHVDADDVRFRLVTVVMERVDAAVIAALSVSLLFVALTRLTSTGVAAGMAAVYGLGTATWAISSQALWEHGLAECCLAGMSVFLLLPDTRTAALAAGAFAAVAVAARPTMVVFVLAGVLFVWRARRRRLLAFCGFLLAGGAVQFLHNPRLVDLLHGVGRGGSFVIPSLRSFLGLLVSPSRGLLVYTPAVALAVPVLLHPRRHAEWVGYLGVGIAGYLVLYSAWGGWWGGFCYGPRLLTDALPAVVLCAVPAVERLRRTPPGLALLAALATWGVLVQAIGVYCDDGSWDMLPASVDAHPQRLWDWSDPQILRAWHAGWHGTDLAPLLWQVITDPHPARLTPLSWDELAGTIGTQEAPPRRGEHGRHLTLRLQVTNHGPTTWPAFSDHGYLDCSLLYEWLHGGVPVERSGGFIRLPRNLAPGESASIRARVMAPPLAGRYELEFDLVQSFAQDRGYSGGTSLRLPIDVD